LYNWDGVCLLRGTDWVFIYNSGYVFCVDLRTNSDYFPIQHSLTGSLYIILHSVHTVHLCVLWGSENKQRLFLYIALTYRVFFITGAECLLRGTDWVFIYNSGYMFCIWEQTAIISLYNIKWLVFRTETECIYCAVRTGSLYIIQFNLTLCSAHTVYCCVLCGCENKQRLFPYTTLTDWFL